MSNNLTPPQCTPRLVIIALAVISLFTAYPGYAAPNGPPPGGVRELQPGQIPAVCTESDNPFNIRGATYGAYWSESAQTWVSAPYCYARWGFLEASPAQIIASGDTVSVTATPDDGRMAGFVAIQGGMSWTYPGERVSGCESKDMTCTVKIGNEDEPPSEWQWHEFHVSGPGRVFILPPSYAPRCQADNPCLDLYTNAWSYVGIAPGDPCDIEQATSLQLQKNTSALQVTAQSPLCKQLGLTWRVEDNLKYEAWSTVDGVIPAALVKRKDFFVNLYLLNGQEEYKTCPANRYYKWKVKSPGKKKANIAGEGCDPTLAAREEGVYKVSVTEFNSKTKKPTGRGFDNRDVIVQDWLIVGMGDSNGSGQGTDVAGDGYAYEFKQCDRGSRSYQYKVAQMIEAADDKTSVTFIHTACSGARTVHLFGKKYVGQEVNFGNPLPPQIRQLKQRIDTGTENLEVDAVILSIGINDSLFGGIIGNCLSSLMPNTNCHTRTYRKYFNPDTGGEPDLALASDTEPGADTMANLVADAVASLPSLYKPVGIGLKQLGILPKRVFITSYPDAMTDDQGNLCSGSYVLGLTSADWAWLSNIGSLLRGQIMQTHAQRKWTPVGSIGDPFTTHGYCASDGWFQGPFGAFANQSNIYGTFHSIEIGHEKMAEQVLPHVCQQMYGNDDCKNATPRPPRKK